MALCLGPQTIEPPVLLAPLAGITDLPYRRLVARFGAGLVVSEMVASQEVVQAQPEARARAELGLEEQATAVQLAGRDPYWMAEAARLPPRTMQRSTRGIAAGEVQVYTLPFFGGSLAEVGLLGDGKANLDLAVALDKKTGKLTATGTKIEVPAPVCIVFA